MSSDTLQKGMIKQKGENHPDLLLYVQFYLFVSVHTCTLYKTY